MSDILLAPEAASSESDVALHSRSGFRDVSPRLKICFIAETVHAGVGRHVVDAITDLSERGHEIHLIYSPIRTDPEFLAAILRQPNVHGFAVSMPRAIGTRDVAAFRKIAAYVSSNGPFDIVHGHSSKGGGYARLLKLLGHGTVFYSPHAFVTMSPLLSRPKQAVYGALEWCLARLTDRVICTSSAEREHAAALGLPKARLSLITNGNRVSATPPRELVRKQLGLEPDHTVIGYAGRMEDQKAPERIVAAAKRLLPELANLVFVMIGGGPKLDGLKASMRGMDFENRVHWLGAVDARQYLAAFDVFVLPSLYEGCPYILLEALAAGLPIVSTPVGGTQEAIEPGVNGFIVPHGAPGEMVLAIRRLATDGDLRRAMSEASRHRAEHFSVPRMVQDMENLYFDVLKAKGAAQRGFVTAPAVSSH